MIMASTIYYVKRSYVLKDHFVCVCVCVCSPSSLKGDIFREETIETILPTPPPHLPIPILKKKVATVEEKNLLRKGVDPFQKNKQEATKVISLVKHCETDLSQSNFDSIKFNPCPAEPGYTLPLQTV